MTYQPTGKPRGQRKKVGLVPRDPADVVARLDALTAKVGAGHGLSPAERAELCDRFDAGLEHLRREIHERQKFIDDTIAFAIEAKRQNSRIEYGFPPQVQLVSPAEFFERFWWDVLEPEVRLAEKHMADMIATGVLTGADAERTKVALDTCRKARVTFEPAEELTRLAGGAEGPERGEDDAPAPLPEGVGLVGKVKLIEALCKDPRLSAKQFRVAVTLILRFHNTKTGKCCPSYGQLAEAANVSKSTAARAVKRLRQMGVVDFAPNDGGRSRHTFYILKKVSPVAPLGEARVGKAVARGTAAVPPVAPQRTQERTQEGGAPSRSPSGRAQAAEEKDPRPPLKIRNQQIARARQIMKTFPRQ